MKIGTSTVTAIYLGTTSIVSAYLGNTLVFGGSFTPLSLFSGGAQGIWLDPSDLSTMFSDRAGTIQVTTPGTVVGKRLDKSGRGNHAVAPTDAARPTYGVEPKGGRRNLLTYSEQIDIAPWTRGSTAITANAAVAPDGTTTSELLYPSSSGNNRWVYQAYTGASAIYTRSVYAKASGKNFLCIDLTGAGTLSAYFNLSTGAVGTVSAGYTASITSVGSGWYRCSVRNSANETTSFGGIYVVVDADNSRAVTANGTDGILLWGAQLETGSTATAYQRVTNEYDVTESGVQTCHYCRYDGFNSSMSTAAIDFTATDKMSVFAGVRKLSDAAQGAFAELSVNVNTNNGSFIVATGTVSVPGPNYHASSKGTILVGVSSTSSFTAPVSNVLASLFDISGDANTLRIDGTQNATATGNQGTGNFGNYPLFIGRRNNATVPFNGKDYGIIVVGKAASAGEITDTETWLAAKTSGVTI